VEQEVVTRRKSKRKAAIEPIDENEVETEELPEEEVAGNENFEENTMETPSTEGLFSFLAISA
jgi:hypothetical protein